MAVTSPSPPPRHDTHPPTRRLSNSRFNWLVQICNHPNALPGRPIASLLTVRSVRPDPLLLPLPFAVPALPPPPPPPTPIHSHLLSVSVSVIRTFSSHTHSLLAHFNFSSGRPLIIFTLEFTAPPLVRVSPCARNLGLADRLII